MWSGFSVAEAPDHNEILVYGRPNVAGREGEEGLGSARDPDELNPQSLRPIHFDHSAQIPSLEAVLREVPVENDSVEFVESHSPLPGKALSKCSKSRR